MKPDIGLIKHALRILDTIGAAGLPEESLMEELEIAAGRPLTTTQAREVLIYCTDRGWTNTRRDDFGRTIHWITEAGKNRYRGL